MYNSIRGVYNGITVQGNSTLAFLDQNGLEWQIEISRTTLGQLPRQGEELRLFTWMQHSEDQYYLCGFVTSEERRVFLELLKVQGIGPRAALRILSGTSPEGLVRLLAAGDLKGLEKIPGLGTKTSQKLLLTLQGKLVLEDSLPSQSQFSAQGPDSDIVQALVDMGFDRKEAQRVVLEQANGLGELSPSVRDQELLRRSIIALS
jgi:Holliday junction DNA helicase RuvA